MRPPKYNVEEYVGQRFVHLTLISSEPVIDEKRNRRYKCQCDCGGVCYREIPDLISGKNAACSIHCKYHTNKKYSHWEVKEFDINGNLIATHESIMCIAKAHNASAKEVESWINEKKVINGSTFHCDEFDFVRPKPKPKSVEYRKKAKDKRIEDGDYVAVPYQQRHGVICITPCPYHEAPKPMVGSSRCHGCSSYITQNRETHHVLCKTRLNHKRI